MRGVAAAPVACVQGRPAGRVARDLNLAEPFSLLPPLTDFGIDGPSRVQSRDKIETPAP